jgi:hypothetical protein
LAALFAMASVTRRRQHRASEAEHRSKARGVGEQRRDLVGRDGNARGHDAPQMRGADYEMYDRLGGERGVNTGARRGVAQRAYVFRKIALIVCDRVVERRRPVGRFARIEPVFYTDIANADQSRSGTWTV